MYLKYWEMATNPFENTPNPRFFFHSQQHDMALMKLLYVVEQRLGAGVLTGTFGSGKTLLIRTLLSELSPDRYRVVLIVNPQLDYKEFILTVTQQLGSTNLPQKRSELLLSHVQSELESMILTEAQAGRQVVVIVDEAHLINTPEMFDTIRLLLNYQTEDQFLVTLLLVGQPELRQRIDANKPLEQRIAVKCHLTPLSTDEIKHYMLYRLKIAGCQRGIFTKGAADLICRYSGGVPRKINRICDLSLLTAMGLDAKKIGPEVIEMVMADIQQMPEK